MKAYSGSIRNAQLLESLYIEQKLSSKDISRQLGVNDRLVRGWLYKFGIPTRSFGEAIQISWNHRRKRALKICPVCSKEFTVPFYRIKRAKKLYCSRECQIKDYAGSLGKACTVFRQAHPRRDKTCPICHTVFSAPFSHWGRRKFCSDQCRGIAQMMVNGAKKTPTIPEQRIIEIVGKHFPDFKYNGNGELAVVLAGMIPDFININGRKQAIEVFGDYYHGQICRNWKNSELGKIMAYNSIGYNCLVLWEHEIKDRTDDELIGIIGKFSKEVTHG
jgi:hypothetical protein